jgi:hypothetical protein
MVSGVESRSSPADFDWLAYLLARTWPARVDRQSHPKSQPERLEEGAGAKQLHRARKHVLALYWPPLVGAPLPHSSTPGLTPDIRSAQIALCRLHPCSFVSKIYNVPLRGPAPTPAPT